MRRGEAEVASKLRGDGGDLSKERYDNFCHLSVVSCIILSILSFCRASSSSLPSLLFWPWITSKSPGFNWQNTRRSHNIQQNEKFSKILACLSSCIKCILYVCWEPITIEGKVSTWPWGWKLASVVPIWVYGGTFHDCTVARMSPDTSKASSKNSIFWYLQWNRKILIYQRYVSDIISLISVTPSRSHLRLRHFTFLVLQPRCSSAFAAASRQSLQRSQLHGHLDRAIGTQRHHNVSQSPKLITL